MSSKQNKSPRKRGGRGKGTPKPKPRSQSRASQAQAAGTASNVPVMSRASVYSNINSLPKMGTTSTSITTKHGSGILVRGTVNIATVKKYNGVLSSQEWSPLYNEAGVSPDTVVFVHPFFLQYANYVSAPSRLAILAQAYTMYKFTRLRLHYTPSCGTTEDNIFAVAYWADIRQIYSYDATLATFSQTVDKDGNTMVTQPWAASVIDCSRELETDEFYYVDVDTASSAGIRQTIQGGIFGGWQGAIPENTNSDLGVIWAEYECILTQPYTVQNEAKLADTDVFKILGSKLSEGKRLKPSLRQQAADLKSAPAKARPAPAPTPSTQTEKAPLTELSRAALRASLVSGDDSLVAVTRTDGSSELINLQHISSGTFESVDAAREQFIKNAQRCAHPLTATRCKATGELVALECEPCQRKHIWAGSPALQSEPGQKK